MLAIGQHRTFYSLDIVTVYHTCSATKEIQETPVQPSNYFSKES